MFDIPIIYWFIYLILLLFALVKKSKRISNLAIPLLFLSILVAIRYEVGHDSVTLTDFYSQASFKEFYIDDFRVEVGAFMPMILFKRLGFGLEFWFFYMAILTLWALMKGIQRFNLCSLEWGLLIYFCLFFFMNQCNIMQHGVMTAFSWLAFSYIKDNNLSRFLLFICIGASFHMLGWLLIPFYWILRREYSISLSIVLLVIAFVLHHSFLNVIYKLVAIGIFESKVLYYQELISNNADARTSISTGVIVYILVYFFVCYFKIGEKEDRLIVVKNALLFSLFFQITFLGSGIFDARLGGLFNISLVILLPYIVSYYKKPIHYIAKSILIVYTLTMFVTTVSTESRHFSSGYEFIPYKTIFNK